MAKISSQKDEKRNGHFTGVLHCPREKSKNVGSAATTTGREERAARSAARHPIFWSHFTKSRSYFTIPLVAAGQCACVPFSIPPVPPFSSSFIALLALSQFVPARVNLTWGTTVSSSAFSPAFSRASYFAFFFSSIPRETTHWDAVICPQFDHKWSPQRGCLLKAPNFTLRISSPLARFSFFFYHFFLRISLLLLVTLAS